MIDFRGLPLIARIGTNRGVFLLQRKTFATGTCPARVWIREVKSFAVEAARKLKRCIAQVKKTLQVCDDLDALVFKHLIVGLISIVEVHAIGQA